ncbi:MAG: hypothetical protein J5789_08900 [Oscillospiraceae bacterium]|nr:hypothetical protein [Oscillospiraceae bacterium]
MERNNPGRKPTRLSFFSYSNTGYYFLAVCARNKEKLFGTIVGGGALDKQKSKFQLKERQI